MTLVHTTFAQLTAQDATRMVQNADVMEEIERENHSEHSHGNASTGILSVLRYSDERIREIMQDAQLEFQQNYFGGGDMLKDVGGAMLELLQQNASARLRRNQFMRGALGHYHSKLESRAAQLLTQQLAHRQSLPATQKRKMLDADAGFWG
jgi:hypothetical protein